MNTVDIIIVLTGLYLLNSWMLGALYMYSVNENDVGPLGKIMLKKTTSQDIAIQKFLIWIIPIYPFWSIIYGLYLVIKWFKKLPPV